jgi:5-methylcytosine-specific restriction endonuclease McrA
VDWKPYSAYGGVYVEITKADHGHGGEGWEFGTCLWSPSHNRVGADRYSIMRRPAPGDLVLHFYAQRWPDGAHESRLAGRSRVAASARQVEEAPPSPGDWAGMAPYQRIELSGYDSFPKPLPLRTLGLEEARAEADAGTDLQDEYVEARRLARERYYFARNPTLARAAKEHYGYACQVCGFDFEAAYGALGHHYIECHHTKPLSERPEEEQLDGATTALEDLAVVCANCHRMLHRRRPALSLDELRTSTLG